MEDLVPAGAKKEEGEELAEQFDVGNVIDIIKIKAEIPSYVDEKLSRPLLDEKDLKEAEEESKFYDQFFQFINRDKRFKNM